MSGGGVPSAEETRYRFLPSVRRGLRPDATFRPDAPASAPGTVTVTLDVEGSQPDGASEEVEAETDVRLYGPGDVIGLDARQVVRTEPADGTTDYPPNYFPHVEFDRPDLPWLFSPERASADDGRARPWLTLVVVERREGVTLEAGTAGPLPALTIRGEEPERELPPPDEVWAWAHAQVVGKEPTLGPEPVADELDARSTRTLSRLVAPRKLEANTAYYACVVPTFEAGRLAGLGEDPTERSGGRPPTAIAWSPADGDAPVRLPVYYHWEFATGPRGDFESLVRALEPRELGTEVGSRPVDLSDPGVEAVAAPWLADGDLRLGGALRSVTFDPKDPTYPAPDDPEAPEDPGRRDELRRVVDRPETIEDATGDPVVGPPTYGRWHADVERLPDPDADPPSDLLDSWLDELNLDPRNRVTAAFGTSVVRDNQEALMAAAWEQYGDLTWANRLVRAAQLARAVGEVTRGALDGVRRGDLLSFTGPMHTQLRWQAGVDRTVYGRIEASPLPGAVVRPSFRRLTRPRGPLSRRAGGSLATGPIVERLSVDGGIMDPGAGLVESTPSMTDRLVEMGAVDAVGDRTTVGGRPSLLGGESAIERSPEYGTDGGTDEAAPPPDDESPLSTEALGRLDSVDDHCLTARSRLSGLRLALRGVAPVDRPESAGETVDRLLAERPSIEERCAAIAGSTFRPLARSLARLLAAAPEAAPGLSNDRKDEILQEMGDRHVDLMGTVGGMADPAWADDPETGSADVGAAIADVDRIMELVDELRRALGVGSTTMAHTAGEAPADVTPLSLSDVPGVADLVDVEGPLVDMVADRIGISREWLEASRDDPLEEVMAAPEIRRPMYEPLRDLSPAYLCPGVGNIPADTVGILETNPPFVEAFMVGLSHEMARELLWRRYPTDRRGTYFRHFWDRRAVPADAGDGSDGDIAPIHHWMGRPLGDNPAEPREGADEDGSRLVLIVRGKLLQRYPNTRIYAVKAVDEDNDDEDDDTPDRVPLFEQRRRELLGVLDGSGADALDPSLGGYTRSDLESWAPKEPIFRGTLAEDVTFFGFELDADAAWGTEEDVDDRGWFFVLEEPPAEPRFGLDVAAGGDFGAVPYGVSYGPGDDREMEEMDTETWEEGPEVGWNGLSWGHLVADEAALEEKTHVEVTADRPSGDGDPAWAVGAGETWTDDGFDEARSWTGLDAATWGENSAHMARITWQLPVRVAVHADDMLPPEALSTRAGGGA